MLGSIWSVRIRVSLVYVNFKLEHSSQVKIVVPSQMVEDEVKHLGYRMMIFQLRPLCRTLGDLFKESFARLFALVFSVLPRCHPHAESWPIAQTPASGNLSTALPVSLLIALGGQKTLQLGVTVLLLVFLKKNQYPYTWERRRE